MKVQNLTPTMFDSWLGKLLQAGLSGNTIRSTLTLLRQSLDYAISSARLISSNPAIYIKVPRNAPRDIVKRTIITPERFAELLIKYPFGTPYYIPLLLLYHTGMRLGEVLGLSWQDIDFANKRINLRRQIIYLKRRGYYFTTLKTKSSKRFILIDDFLLAELRRWQIQQTENEKQFGDSYVYIYCESDGYIQRQSKGLPVTGCEKISLICTRNDGRLVLKETFVSVLQAEGLNVHSFRHTHATQLIELGATPKGGSRSTWARERYYHAKFVYAQYAEITARNRRNFRRKSADKSPMQTRCRLKYNGVLCINNLRRKFL